MPSTSFTRLKNIQLQAMRASASYSLLLSLNNSMMLAPDQLSQALGEELEEDDDA
jgi:hypothetical protein